MRGPLLVLCALVASASSAQLDETTWRDSLAAYWDRIEVEFLDPGHSPLRPEDRPTFHGLERFPADPMYRVQASYRAKPGKEFGMATTTDRRPTYSRVGQLTFRLDGRKCRLNVYRNKALSEQAEYTDYLFVPFTDPTNGEETYGGGRYIDLQAPLGKLVELDLNKAYNPYCAYGGKYSCPIPPAQNHLPVPVRAGVKAFAH
jgi:uncharacterized protein (DUF1684 family)